MVSCAHLNHSTCLLTEATSGGDAFRHRSSTLLVTTDAVAALAETPNWTFLSPPADPPLDVAPGGEHEDADADANAGTMAIEEFACVVVSLATAEGKEAADGHAKPIDGHPPRRAVVRQSRVSTAPRMSSPDTPRGTQHCHVYLENDSVNLREYVARVLMMVCDLSESEAMSVMTEASSNWMARCGTWEKAVAQHVYDGLHRAGLSVVMAPAVEDGGGTSDDSDPRPRYLDGTLIEEESDLPGWYGRGRPGKDSFL